MIILFTSSLGLTAVKYKRNQLEYIDNLIYMGNMILLLLKSTMPETEIIISTLSADSKLQDFDFSLKNEKLLLSNEDNERVRYLISSIGKYDVDSQISITCEFIGYFKMLREQYQDYYNRHYKLYLVIGLFSGIAVSVLLI